MAYYATHMHRVLTGRAGDWLARNGWPHLMMAAVFGLSAWAGYQCSLWLAGWSGFALRFSVNFLAAYAVYLMLLALWLSTKPSLDRAALLDGAPDTIETANPWDHEACERRQEMIGIGVRSANQQQAKDGAGGLVGLAVVTMILGPLFVAGHMMWYARWYLGRLLVLGGKIHHRTLDQAPALAWLTAPLRLTMWAAVILLVHYALLGLILQWAFPQAVTIADIVPKQ